MSPPFLGLFQLVGRNVSFGDGLTQVVVLIDLCLHGQKVNDPDKGVLFADRQLDGYRIGAQPVFHHLDDMKVVSPRDVHLVDIANPGHTIGIGLSPDRFRLGLHTAFGTQNSDRPVQYTKRSFYLDSKVDVAGRVDDVNSTSPPGRGGRSRGDGNPPVLFLWHPVHGGGTLMGFAQPVDASCVVEDALRRRRLAGVDMGHDAYISCILK